MLASTQDGAEALAGLMRAAVVCAVALFLWSAYNQRRYGGRDRRRAVAEACPQAIADFFGATPVVSQRLRSARRTILHVDPGGRPVRAVIPPPALHGKGLPHGSDAERERSERLATALGPAAEVWPRLSLDALLDRLAACKGAIGVDSGLSHIAVALELPHVQIYNFDTAWRTGPVGLPRQRSVFATPTPSIDAVWDAWTQVTQVTQVTMPG